MSKGEEREIQAFKPGDTITVYTRIREGEKKRIQPFQGVVIQKRGSGISKTFTVRRTSGRYGVERIFPIESPNIAEIKVMRRGKVRRAKLFYLRHRKGKKAKVKEERRG
jgi:large subunit ribosomal protein L19